MIKISQNSIFEIFREHAPKISTFEFSKKWIFSSGGRGSEISAEVHATFRARQKFLQTIFHHHRRAHIKFLRCAPPCAHTVFKLVENSSVFQFWQFFKKTKLRKACACSTEGARAKTFYKNQEG